MTPHNSTQDSLTGIQINCRSINNKLGNLKILIHTQNPDYVALSETWITHHSPKF